MLKLKRVELQGFKSFCDRTELRFNGSGVAGVVGPNGCGKSNIADAINWVLGEQSAKSLRGARMEDVIFAGTRDRKPVGMAAVTMTLMDPQAHVDPKTVKPAKNGTGKGLNGANGAGALGVPKLESGQEITVTRRLFRSGESEYLVNGRPARLRDIQDIFMGTGLGPESYAIIEQGRIGQLLSSRPQDRRAVIEEAAGISRFKAKRRLAEAKLEGARHNLERVFDILEEVGRQVNSLKRQASKAKRYLELKADMDAQLRSLLAARYQMLERETARIALDLNMAGTALQSLSADAAQKEQEYSRAQTAGYDTEARLTEARKRLSELHLELERTRSRLEYQAKQIASIDQRLAQGEREAQELETRSTHAEQELKAHREGLVETDRATEDARRRLEAKNADRERARQAAEQRERSMEGARQTVLRLLGEASSLKNQLGQIDTFLASLDRDFNKARYEEQSANADLERVGKIKDELTVKRAAQQMDLESMAEQRKRLEEELAVRRNQSVSARRDLETVRNEFSRLKARHDSLDEILSHRAYTTESVKRLFTAIERGQAQALKPAGVLADFVEVDPAYEKAAEEFLHEELEYIVVKNWQDAEYGIEVMRSSVEGRATFLVHPEGDVPSVAAGPEPPVGPETGTTARLRDVLKLTNGLSRTSIDLLPRLAQCFLAVDRESAQRLATLYPHLYFLLPDGVCYRGQAVSGGKKSSSGPLALKRELREIKVQVQDRQRKLNQTASRIEELDAEIAEFQQEIERLRSLQQNREKETLALDHEVRKLSEELSRANSRLSVARLELDRLGKEKERSIARREQARLGAEEKDRTRAAQEQALEAGKAELDQLRRQAAAVAEEHSSLRVELAGLEERGRADRGSIARLEGQLRDLTHRRQIMQEELQRQGVERARLLSSNVELDQRAAQRAQLMKAAEEEVATLAEQETKLRASLTQLEEHLKLLRVQVQDAQEKKSQTELELVKRQAELKYLDETSRKELNTPVSELAPGEEIVLDEEALGAIERKYQDIRTRIENLGPVNPQAHEEFQEAQQRYEFLNTQRQDLLDSIRDTNQAIQSIDVESKKRFVEAFGTVNTYFREIFLTLFGGGVCEMRLTDEQNVAESGIDIVASPPGKRLQNVLLLSGGEKALIALALLMAIFKYQPSPFCILDEVDAPLDEPNIERLTRLIRDMAAQTQFIIITHSKRTMESAQALYGVTMQEPGVSSLVSVKLTPVPPPPPLPSNLESATM